MHVKLDPRGRPHPGSLIPMDTLHGFCQSGNTFKVAFLLRALNQEWKPQFVDFMNGVTRMSGWCEAANEMGEVSMLEEEGCRLAQSGDPCDVLPWQQIAPTW